MRFPAAILLLAAPALAQAHDEAHPSPPGAVRVASPLAERLHGSLQRLLAVDEDELLAGFRRRPGKQAWIGEHAGKWLDAACATWLAAPDAALAAKIARVRDGLLACQDDDGYLGTYVAGQRFALHEGADWDVWVHKYCLLGLLAEHARCGHPGALAACRRIGDLLAKTFGEGGADIVAAGTHRGMAATSVLEPLVLLHRATREARYLALARRIAARLDDPAGPDLTSALAAGRPVHLASNGKAYEMLSNLLGLCELHRETGERAFLDPVLTAWQDIAEHRLYPTGSGSCGERWQPDGRFPLGPEAAVAETCVTVTWMQLNAQLLRLTGEARFAAALERTLWNHLLAAQHPGGHDWCYFTPLEGVKDYRSDTNCCHSSGPRGLALLPPLMVTTSRAGVQVQLLGFAAAAVEVEGTPVVLRVAGAWPRGADVELRVTTPREVTFALALRVPEGLALTRAACQGEALEPGGDGWLRVRRAWRDGDALRLEGKLAVRRLAGEPFGHPGKVALQRGPCVLAVEQSDDLPPLGALALADDDPWILDGPCLSALRMASVRPLGARHSGLVVPVLPFADAGATGKSFRVFLRADPAAADRALSLLAFGEESWSRPGNVAGSLADGDPASFRVTWDGKYAAEDWFQVAVPQPFEVVKVVYRHGRCFHDGGWFDASAGRPRIEGRTPDGAWTPLGRLDAYRDTTADDAKGLTDGEAFELRCAPTSVTAVRILGRGACGDAPGQRFASCAELEAFGSG